jgi:hypothetical protein
MLQRQFGADPARTATSLGSRSVPIVRGARRDAGILRELPARQTSARARPQAATSLSARP